MNEYRNCIYASIQPSYPCTNADYEYLDKNGYSGTIQFVKIYQRSLIHVFTNTNILRLNKHKVRIIFSQHIHNGKHYKPYRGKDVIY